MIGPRHTTIDVEPKSAARQNGENARDTRVALATKVAGKLLTVEQYTAVGSTSARIRLGSIGRPAAVLLARAAEFYAQNDPIGAVGTLNFAWDSTTGAIDVYEPSGLAADTVYTLSFLALEA